jgi:hypothetical protein
VEKQMQAWRENPSWVDQTPEIKVRKFEAGELFFSLPTSLS